MGVSFVIAAAIAAVVMPMPGLAGTEFLGYVSFDNLIPGSPGSPGVNGFTIANLTGDPNNGGNDLPPTFPVITRVMFLNSSLEWFSGSSSKMVPLGDLGPGFYNPAALMFPDTDTFSSALFTTTLDTTSLQLDGGGGLTAVSDEISVLLLPSRGTTLIAGTDFALIPVSTLTSPTPEPNNLLVLGLILFGLWHWRRNALRKGVPSPRERQIPS